MAAIAEEIGLLHRWISYDMVAKGLQTTLPILIVFLPMPCLKIHACLPVKTSRVLGLSATTKKREVGTRTGAVKNGMKPEMLREI